MRTLLPFCLALSITLWLLITQLEPLFSIYFNPAYYRVFFWQSGLSFFMGPLSLLVFVFGYLVKRRESSLFSWSLFGLSLALAIFCFMGLEIRRPTKINWDIQMQPQEDLATVVSRARSQAKLAGKPILFYFYANWCPSCPDFERFVLAHPHLQKVSHGYFKCRLDVTDMQRWHLYLERNFLKITVPAVAIYSRQGKALYPVLRGEHVSLNLAFELLLSGFD